MNQRAPRQSAADIAAALFEGHFFRTGVTAEVGAEPTVGPLAKQAEDAGPRRTPSHVTRTADVSFAGKTAAAAAPAKAVVTPAGSARSRQPAQAVVSGAVAAPDPDVEKQALAQPDLSESSGPGTSAPISAISITGGTAPYVGADVGNLPGPVREPMTTDTAPGKGKRGPSASDVSKQIAAGIKGRLRSKAKGSPVPQVVGSGDDPNEDVRRRQVPNEGSQDRMSTTLSGPNGPEIHTGYGREKIGSLLAVIGVPPSLVSEDSVVFQALAEKIAKVQAPASDNEVSLFTRDDTNPLALWTNLGARYGDSWLDWDAEVVGETLAKDIGREPSAVTMNKIAALQIVGRNPLNTFTRDWHAFEKICIALDGHAPRMTMIEDLSPEQMAFGVGVIRGLKHGVVTFEPELRRYCAARLFDAGMVVAPPELGFCDQELAQIAGKDQADLRKRALTLYQQALSGQEPRDIDTENPPADFVQASRLLRIHAYVIDRIDDLVRQLA